MHNLGKGESSEDSNKIETFVIWSKHFHGFGMLTSNGCITLSSPADVKGG